MDTRVIKIFIFNRSWICTVDDFALFDGGLNNYLAQVEFIAGEWIIAEDGKVSQFAHIDRPFPVVLSELVSRSDGQRLQSFVNEYLLGAIIEQHA